MDIPVIIPTQIKRVKKVAKGLLSFCLLTTALLVGGVWSWGLVTATSGSVSDKRSKAFWSFLSVVAFVMTVMLSTKCVVFPSYPSQFLQLKSYHISYLFHIFLVQKVAKLDSKVFWYHLGRM